MAALEIVAVRFWAFRISELLQLAILAAAVLISASCATSRVVGSADGGAVGSTLDSSGVPGPGGSARDSFAAAAASPAGRWMFSTQGSSRQLGGSLTDSSADLATQEEASPIRSWNLNPTVVDVVGSMRQPHGSEQAALSVLRDGASRLSTEDKLTVVQTFGDLFLSQYDANRLELSTALKFRVVGLDDLLTADRLSREANASGTVSTRKGGVCRDIASAQGQMLTALGVPNARVVAYAAQLSYHATVIASDPDASSLRYHELNYGVRVSSSVEEGAQLLAPLGLDVGGEAGLQYVISRPYGASVASVPSSLHQALLWATGTDPEIIEPLTTRRSSSAVAQYTSSSQNTQARLVLDDDGRYSRYGGAVTAWAQRSELSDTRLAGVVLLQQPHMAQFDPSIRSLLYGYAQALHQLRTPQLALGTKSLLARLEATAIGVAGWGLMMPGRAAGQGPLGNGAGTVGTEPGPVDVNAYLNTGLEIVHTASATWTTALRLESQLTRGVTNSSSEKPAPLWNHATARLVSRWGLQALGLGPESHVTVSSDVVVDQIGVRVREALAVGTELGQLRVSYVGRVSSESPLYREGSLRRARVDTQINVASWLSVYAAAEVLLERAALQGSAPGWFGLGIQGDFSAPVASVDTLRLTQTPQESPRSQSAAKANTAKTPAAKTAAGQPLPSAEVDAPVAKAAIAPSRTTTASMASTSTSTVNGVAVVSSL